MYFGDCKNLVRLDGKYSYDGSKVLSSGVPMPSFFHDVFYTENFRDGVSEMESSFMTSSVWRGEFFDMVYLSWIYTSFPKRTFPMHDKGVKGRTALKMSSSSLGCELYLVICIFGHLYIWSFVYLVICLFSPRPTLSKKCIARMSKWRKPSTNRVLDLMALFHLLKLAVRAIVSIQIGHPAPHNLGCSRILQ